MPGEATTYGLDQPSRGSEVGSAEGNREGAAPDEHRRVAVRVDAGPNVVLLCPLVAFQRAEIEVVLGVATVVPARDAGRPEVGAGGGVEVDGLEPDAPTRPHGASDARRRVGVVPEASLCIAIAGGQRLVDLLVDESRVREE